MLLFVIERHVVRTTKADMLSHVLFPSEYTNSSSPKKRQGEKTWLTVVKRNLSLKKKQKTSELVDRLDFVQFPRETLRNF